MKYCSQCGAKNDDNAKFCSKCGAALNTDSHLSRTKNDNNNQTPPTNKKWPWIVTLLVVIIIILVFIVGAAIGSKPTTKSKEDALKSTQVAKKQSAKSAQSSQADANTYNLSASNLTPEQTATAIAYYQGTNSLAWSALSTEQMSHNVYITNNTDEDISNKGAGVTYWFGAIGDGYSEYTLSNNGKTVNIYQINGGSNGVQDPKESVSLETIVDTINQKKAAQTVRNTANGVHIKDNRYDESSASNNIDTTKLNKQQLENWALQTFKDTYASAADDDLSVEYNGVSSNNYAEVTIHDHDNSVMNTIYRVNENGALQEKSGDEWETVSTTYTE